MNHHPIKRVALETTLLTHGVPSEAALNTADALRTAVESHGGVPRLCAILDGRPTTDLTNDQLQTLLQTENLPKLNTPNLPLAIHRKRSGATTVSTTLELAHAAGIRLFATGAIGGVHPPVPPAVVNHDVSTDLHALTRFPVAVVSSGVKSILDVASTRERLETLGVTVVGYGTDAFPSFYQRAHPDANPVDERFDDPDDLAMFLLHTLPRSRGAVLIANPIPAEHEIEGEEFDGWLEQARAEVERSPSTGRDVTPALLGCLHRVSGGRTLEANVALAVSNASLGGRLAASMASAICDRESQ